MSSISQSLARAITDFGDDAVTGSLAAALTCGLLLMKHRRAAFMFASAVICTIGVLAIAKMALYSRCDPSSSFLDLRSPSGHSGISVAVYGLFAAFVSTSLSGWRRILPFLVAAPLIVLISISRVLLEAHTAADVIAGSVVGLSISLGTWMLFMRREIVRIDWRKLLLIALAVLLIMYGVHFSAEGIIAAIARYFRTRVPC